MTSSPHSRLIKKSLIAAAVGVPLFFWDLLKNPAVAPGTSQIIWTSIGLISLCIMIYAGSHFFSGAWKAFCAHRANMYTLIAVAIGPAWLYSFLVSLVPWLFPMGAREIHYDTSLTVIALILFGTALETKASEAIESSANTFLSSSNEKLARIAQKAAHLKPSIGKFSDKMASILAPLVLMIALLTTLFWLDFGPEPRFSYALSNFMAVLLIACPCALGLAVPIAISSGMSKGWEHGIFFCDAEALEDCEEVSHLIIDREAFDKPPPPSLQNRLQAKGITLQIPESPEDLYSSFANKPKGKTALITQGGQKDSLLQQADITILTENQGHIDERGNILLMSKDWALVFDAFSLAKTTMRNIRQNLTAAFLYNVLGIPLAAGILYPFTGTMFPPLASGLLMALSSLGVVSNALRLRRWRRAPKETVQ